MFQPPWVPAGRQPLKYLMVARRSERNPTFSAGRAGGIQTHLKNFPQSTKFFLRAANFLSCKSPQKPRKSSIFHRFYRQFTVFENFSNFFAIFVDKGGYPCYNISCRWETSGSPREINASVLELVDRHVWGACVDRRTGSSPVTRTTFFQQPNMRMWRNGRRASFRC